MQKKKKTLPISLSTRFEKCLQQAERDSGKEEGVPIVLAKDEVSRMRRNIRTMKATAQPRCIAGNATSHDPR